MKKYLLFSLIYVFFHYEINYSMQSPELTRLTPAVSRGLRRAAYKNPHVACPSLYRTTSSNISHKPQEESKERTYSSDFNKPMILGMAGLGSAVFIKTAYSEKQIPEPTILQKFERNLDLQKLIKRYYGLLGFKTIERILAVLNEFSPNSEIMYHESSRQFEISKSSHIDRKMLEDALGSIQYEGWQPKVEKKKNPNANLSIKLVIAKKKLDNADMLPKDIHQSLPKLPSQYYTHNQIIEALQSEAVFTHASDSKPIAATYGAAPCIAVAGWDPTNKVAFVVHFANAKEVEVFQNQLLQNIIGLTHEQPKQPLELHLRGGIEGKSEDTVNAITQWVKNQKYPMVITTASILKYGQVDKSIAIDARTGKVYDYDPLKNPHHRKITDFDTLKALMSAYDPHITVAYKAQKPSK